MPVKRVDQLSYRSQLANEDGSPTAEFIQQWNLLLEFIQGSNAENINVTAPITGGGLASSSPTIGHATSGVAAATYGDANNVPQITIDATGHVTSAVDIPITASGAGLGARTTRTTTQSIAASTDTLVDFTTEVFDTSGFVDLGSNDSRITIPSGVSYAVLFAAVEWSSITSNKFTQIKYNGNFLPNAEANQGLATGTVAGDRGNVTTGLIAVTPGDYFEVSVRQNGGGALNMNGCTFSILAFA